uniref:CCHC-type domain-containing protein n=1 Tax=Cacopsylla melanoneura TaxID=428564 RepID=A0A8D8UE46_9HEMI
MGTPVQETPVKSGASPSILSSPGVNILARAFTPSGGTSAPTTPLAGKRNRDDEYTQQQDVGKIIGSLKDAADELFGLMLNHTNTQTDIKAKIKIVKVEATRLSVLRADIESAMAEMKEVKRKRDDERKKEGPAICIKCKEKLQKDGEKMEAECTAISSLHDADEFRKKAMELAEEEWPESTFKNVEIQRGALMECLKADLCVLVGEGDERSQLIQLVKQRHADVEELIQEDTQELQVMETQTRVNNRVSSSSLCLGKINGDKKLGTYTRLIQLVERHDEDTPLSLALTEGLQWGYARKIAELLCRKAKKKVRIVVPGGFKEESGLKREKDVKKIQIRLGENNQEGNITSIMRDLKKEVNITNNGVEIDGVTCDEETRFIEIRTKEGRKGAFDNFVKEVRDKVESKATLKVFDAPSGLVNLVVRGIDATTDEAEVLEAIRRLTGCNEANARVINLKPNYRNNGKVAKVAVSRVVADALLPLGRIAIGWVKCPVDLMIEPMQCFKCMKHGHRSAQCKSPSNMINRCRKCLGTGHMAKDCQRAPKCADCSGDHRTGVMACDMFRTMVSEGRAKAASDRGSWEVVTERGKNWSRMK